jgi:hypothetical protein
MNHRPAGLSVSKAIVGFLQYKAAEGLDPNTLISYRHHLHLLAEHLQDRDVSQVTARHRQCSASGVTWFRYCVTDSPWSNPLGTMYPQSRRLATCIMCGRHPLYGPFYGRTPRFVLPVCPQRRTLILPPA